MPTGREMVGPYSDLILPDIDPISKRHELISLLDRPISRGRAGGPHAIRWPVIEPKTGETCAAFQSVLITSAHGSGLPGFRHRRAQTGLMPTTPELHRSTHRTPPRHRPPQWASAARAVNGPAATPPRATRTLRRKRAASSPIPSQRRRNSTKPMENTALRDWAIDFLGLYDSPQPYLFKPSAGEPLTPASRLRRPRATGDTHQPPDHAAAARHHNPRMDRAPPLSERTTFERGAPSTRGALTRSTALHQTAPWAMYHSWGQPEKPGFRTGPRGGKPALKTCLHRPLEETWFHPRRDLGAPSPLPHGADHRARRPIWPAAPTPPTVWDMETPSARRQGRPGRFREPPRPPRRRGGFPSQNHLIHELLPPKGERHRLGAKFRRPGQRRQAAWFEPCA